LSTSRIDLSPERIAEVQASFQRQGLMRALGAQLTALEHGQATVEMTLSDQVTQQHGFFHGGAIGALADTACGYAALSTVPQGKAGLTAEYKINLLAPADGDRLIAVGRVLRAGRTLIICQAEVEVEKQGRKKACAVALMTLCVVNTLGGL
jgi:uncharacterized protein (TIGR00369 family)